MTPSALGLTASWQLKTGLPSAANRRAALPNPQSSALLIVVRLLSALTAPIKYAVLTATQKN